MYTPALFISLSLGMVTSYAQSYEPQGTTVKKVGCNVMLILQVALENDSTGDVANIQAALDGCFSLTCDLPCANGKKGRCAVITKAVVVSWSSLGAADRSKFHHINMLSGQGVSFVNSVGVPNETSTGGSWYRNEYSPKVYCHETMHLAGLKDHYRDCRANRLALGVDNCKDGDTCTAAQKAAGACPACHGYEDDLMGTDVTKAVDCNMDIIEVLRLANNPLNPEFICPDSCCEEVHRTVSLTNPSSGTVPKLYTGGLNEIDLLGSFMHFGDKDFHYNSWGFSGEYTRYCGNHPRIGATFDAGYYWYSEGQGDFKQNYGQLNLTAGITWRPCRDALDPAKKFAFSTHALAGISIYSEKYTSVGSNPTGGTYTYSQTSTTKSFTINVGAALDWKLSSSFKIRLPQVDYTPTFFYKGTQNNYRLSAGVGYNF